MEVHMVHMDLRRSPSLPVQHSVNLLHPQLQCVRRIFHTSSGDVQCSDKKSILVVHVPNECIQDRRIIMARCLHLDLRHRSKSAAGNSKHPTRPAALLGSLNCMLLLRCPGPPPPLWMALQSAEQTRLSLDRMTGLPLYIAGQSIKEQYSMGRSRA